MSLLDIKISSVYCTCLPLFGSYFSDESEPYVEEQDSSNLQPLYIVVGCAVFIIISLVLFVVVGRKRARGITWFPEGFFQRGGEEGASSRSSKRHGPDGGEELK